MEALKRGDKVTVVHVYDPPYGWKERYSARTYEVIYVQGVYVQRWGGEYGGTHRYYAKSLDALSRTEVVLRPAHDATTPAYWGYSIRVKRVETPATP